LINNRQGGRRRGRGGGGGRAPNMNPGAGNRQDNRQRGNAAQLLEKYKGLARDAQMQGDRVQTEYFLQFADHYFRVLGESRARFEEQRRQRGEDFGDAEDIDGDDELEAAERPAYERAEEPREPRETNSRDADDGRDERPRNGDGRGRRPRNRRFERAEEGDANGIALDALPPSIAAAPPVSDDAGDGEAEAPRAPRRRARRPRGEAEDIAPAA
jgi:hypothetical protein